jgi:hypothetical protein
VFENRVLRKVFGPKRDEVKREKRKLHNEELHILYLSPSIIRQIKSRRMRWVGYVAPMGEYRKVLKVLVGKPEGKSSLGRPRRRWEHGNRMDLMEMGWGVECIQLAQNRGRLRALVNAVMNLRVLAPQSYLFRNQVIICAQYESLLRCSFTNNYPVAYYFKIALAAVSV